ncbi:hypothetical protein ACVWW6_000023 [Bradyrhizobium sp. USDA 3311]
MWREGYMLYRIGTLPPREAAHLPLGKLLSSLTYCGLGLLLGWVAQKLEDPECLIL